MVRSGAWRSWLASPLGISLVFLLSLPAVTHRLNASDEIEYFAWLRSAAFDRDADFENEYRYFYEAAGARDALFRETFLERVNENGRRHNFAPIGTAILWSPFYGVAHVLAGFVGFPRDGYSHPYIYAVTVASAIYGWLALLISMAIARRLESSGSAAWVIWLGTPLLFYMYLAPGFSHACSAFAVSLFIWVWLRVRDHWTPSGALQLGAAAALMAMVREQDLFFAIGPAIDFLWWWSLGRDQGPRAGIAAAGLAAFAIVYTPQLVAYVALNGHPGPDATVAHKMTWTSPHLAGVLFSTEHGLFAWTPAALLAFIGLLRLAVKGNGGKVRRTKYEVRGRARGIQPSPMTADTRWIGLLALLMFALQAYVSGSVESWTVAGSFGQRRFVSLTPILVLGLSALGASADDDTRQGVPHALHRAIYLPALFLCVWWNVGLMAQFGLHLMDRQKLTLGQNARFTFLELPLAAPSIAWRYLTDRESFYRLPPQ